MKLLTVLMMTLLAANAFAESQCVDGSVSYTSPLQGALSVVSRFSPARVNPITGEITPHNGTDYRCKVGEPVYSMRSGLIEYLGETGAAGNMIVISHPDGARSVYMHLNTMEVHYSKKVLTGELIGTCGATGRALSSTLHVEIHNPSGKPIDPMTVVGQKLHCI